MLRDLRVSEGNNTPSDSEVAWWKLPCGQLHNTVPLSSRYGGLWGTGNIQVSLKMHRVNELNRRFIYGDGTILSPC